MPTASPRNEITTQATSMVRFLVFLLILTVDCEAACGDSLLPRTIRLGASLGELKPQLTDDCGRLEELQYSGRMAAPFERQIQVNCHGLKVFGANRHVEFMFNDGPLGHVWIMVQATELEELGATLARHFGSVVHQTDLDSVFASGTVALRRSPPEVLVATPELISELTGFPGKKP